MESITDKPITKARIWPWVVIAVGLLLLLVSAVLLVTPHSKPRLEFCFAGYEAPFFQGELKAVFWVTNCSSRTIIFQLKWYETNVLGSWRASTKEETMSRRMLFAQGNGEEKIFLTPPEGAHTWRARFVTETEAKGWEIYWEYAKMCFSNLSHGWPLPQHPRSTKWYTHPEEAVGPVVSSK